MARIVKRHSDRERVCRLCEKPIASGEIAYTMIGVHVPPKRRDLHMHLACLHEALEKADASEP